RAPASVAPEIAGDTTNFFLYAGTDSGKIFVTRTGGGANGNEWTDISIGLDGSGVRTIVTNPLRGSHEAYAVTEQGIYFLADSTVPIPTWVKIDGVSSDIFGIKHSPFGDSTLAETQLKTLQALVADWRYTIPDDLNNPQGPTH